MKKFVPEILKQVNDAKTKAERVRVLEANNIRPVRNVLALNFDKNIELDLPEGAHLTIKIKKSLLVCRMLHCM